MKQSTYQKREQKWLATDINVQAIIPEQGTWQLRSRMIATRDVHQNSSSLEPRNIKGKITIDEDLLSRLRYMRSRLEDSEISTDAVEQIDEELETTAASLNKQLQVSIGLDTGLGLDSDQGALQEEKSQPSIPPRPKQNFRDLHRQQIKYIQKDSEVVNTSDKDVMVPVSHNHNHNFATVNRANFRLMKSSPPKIPAQPVNIVPPVLPDMVCSNDVSNKLKLVTAEDASAIPICQVQQKLSLYPNGQPPLSLQKCEPVKSSQTVNQDRDIML